MTIPITRQEIIALGARVPSEAVIAEIDRLVPIATADRVVLEAGGYPPALLEQLRSHRATLTEETAARRAQRAQKKSARVLEADALVEGLRILRGAIAMAETAIAYRIAPEGEPAETTQRLAVDLRAALEATRGPIGRDTAKLRTRLTAIAAVLGSPSLAPDEAGRAARAAMIERVTGAATALAGFSEDKKAAQQEALANTDALDEIDGRAYLNLRMLTKVGRAQWRLAGDSTRADVYRLQLRARRAPRPAPDPTPA